MKITHKTPPFQLWDWLKHHLSYTITTCILLGMAVSAGGIYAYFSSDIKINNAKIVALEKTVTELKSEITTDKQNHASILEWMSIIENHQQKLLAEAKLANDQAEIKRIETLIKKLDKE